MTVTEYNTLRLRQDAIILDMNGVARAIEKVNNGAAKAVLAQIGTGILQGFRIPFAIPSNLGYGVLGIWGIIPQAKEFNKLRKYYARLEELRIEWESNYLKIKDYQYTGGLDTTTTITPDSTTTEPTPTATNTGILNSTTLASVRNAITENLTPTNILIGVAVVFGFKKYLKSKSKKRK